MRTRIVLLFSLVIAATVAVFLHFALNAYFIANAKNDLQNLLLSHRGFHQYIQMAMHPTFFEAMKEGKIQKDFYDPKMLSSTYIVRNMHNLYNEERKKEGLEPIYYKMAANNPRNPVNKADELESVLIKRFNDDRNLKEYEEVVKLERRKYLYYAIPFLKNEAKCLRCHGDPKDAPIGLRMLYPGDGGFYEKVGEIRAIASIRIPVEESGYIAMMTSGGVGSGLFAMIMLTFFNRGLRQRVKERTESLENEIKERIKAEQETVAREEKFRNLFNQSADAILMLAENGNIIDANEVACKRYQYSREELTSMNVVQLNGDRSAEGVQRRLERTRLENTIAFEIEHKAKDGTLMPTEANARYVRNNEESYLIVTYRDIRERQKAEEERRENEKRYRLLFESANDGIFILDEHGFVDCNNRGAGMYGLAKEQLIGRSPYNLSPERQPDGRNSAEEITSTMKKVMKGEPQQLEWQSLRVDGTPFDVDITLNRTELAGKAFLQCIARDMTDRKRAEKERLQLEEQLRQAQKLESIGTLAGGIAHDFNNLLQGIFGYISLATTCLDNPRRANEMLRQAEEALHVTVNLTNQLLTFSKGGKPAKKIIQPELVVENSARFALSGSNAGYTLSRTDDLWSIDADEGQISQVIQNIVLNANEAMAESGTVRISVRNANTVSESVKGLPEGKKFVRIDIEDTGVGIPKQNISRIFDPYFTTKKKGSGLGLATSYSIIKNHGGIIEVASEASKGTTFSIYLPAVETKEATNGQAIRQQQVSCKRCKVLLMDDEEIIRNVAKDMMEHLGQEIVCVPDGKAAIDTFREARDSGNPVDLVILDLTVKGGMGGGDAIGRIREIDPNVKAVVSSGYADSEIVANYKAYGFSALLTKPYTLEGLKNCINSLLQ